MPDFTQNDQAEFECWLDSLEEVVDWLSSSIDELNRQFTLPDNYQIPF